MKTELGYLKRGDIFTLNGVRYKVSHLIDRDINNVSCRNLETNILEHFDLGTEVEPNAKELM